MNILDILKEDLIIPELRSETKKGVLEELASLAVKRHDGFDLDLLVERLQEREKLGSTGVGDGVAIPHAKLPGAKAVISVFGRSVGGIDFDSMDGKNAHLFFLLIAPEETSGEHLKALARVSRLMHEADFRMRLMEAKSREELFQIFADEDARY